MFITENFATFTAETASGQMLKINKVGRQNDFFNPLIKPWSLRIPHLHSVLSGYREFSFHDELPYPRYPLYDVDFHKACAKEFSRAVHFPQEPETKRAYEAFKAETWDQFEHLRLNGFYGKVVDREPYPMSMDMRESVRNTGHLKVLKCDDLPTDHPLAAPAPELGWNFMEVFRFVHDISVHCAYGFEFGPRGEEAAFRAHAALYSMVALPALVAETRMQSAFIFAGPQALDAVGKVLFPKEFGYIPLSMRTYAKQKAFMPSHFCCKI